MNTHFDINKVDIPHLIRTNKYYQYINSIKNYENSIQKLLSKNNSIIDSHHYDCLLWNLSETENNDLFPKIKNFNLEELLSSNGINLFSKSDIIVLGPYIRSHLNYSIEFASKLRTELYFYKCNDKNWEEIIDLSQFIEQDSDYIFQNENINISIVKKTHNNVANILLQHDYIKRVLWNDDHFIVSSMFLIEIQKHGNLMYTYFIDPILFIPYDPMNVYTHNNTNIMHPCSIIDSIDYQELQKLPKKNFNKLFNGKLCIELCLDKLSKEEHPVLIYNLKNMIVFLCSFKYKRPPYLYAKLIHINDKYPDIYELLKNIYNDSSNSDSIYSFNTNGDYIIESIDDINNFVFNKIISRNSVNNFLNYMTFLKKTDISMSLIELMIRHNSQSIIKHIIKNNLIDKHLKYYLILMTENLELLKEISETFEIELCINYLQNILENGKIRSFYFLYDKDNTIIDTLFNDGKNVLHCVKQNGEYKILIEMLLKLKPELINLVDDNKETPLLYHSRTNIDILKEFLSYDFNYMINNDDGDTFIHLLCTINESKNTNVLSILKDSIKRCPEIIDIPNKKMETPIIISTQNNNENMFHILKGFGANLDTQDQYGNTCYHYICLNKMCIGTTIPNKANYFGVKPLDYSNISKKYYNEINTH